MKFKTLKAKMEVGGTVKVDWDEVPIGAKVFEFLVDGVTIGWAGEAARVLDWTTYGYEPGTHFITIRAYGPNLVNEEELGPLLETITLELKVKA